MQAPYTGKDAGWAEWIGWQLERALQVTRAAYGPDPDHPTVARDVNNLGMLLRDLGELPPTPLTPLP